MQSKTNIHSVARFSLFLCCLLAGPKIWATPLYGLTYASQGVACDAACSFAPAINLVNTQQLAYSNSFSLSGGAGGQSGLSGAINGQHLNAQSVTGYPFTGAHVASNSGDLYWFDTFTFAPGTYAVHLFFRGSVSQQLPGGQSGGTVDTFNLLENGTVIPGQQYSGIVQSVSPGSQATLDLTFGSNSTMVLGDLLQIRNQILTSSSAGSGSVNINDLDAYFSVSPITQGASFVTASGLSYAPIPEPSTTVLAGVALALFGVGLFQRTRPAAR